MSALGVSAPRGCLLPGGVFPGGVFPGGVSVGGVCSRGVCSGGGGGGLSAPRGGIPACTEADTPL